MTFLGILNTVTAILDKTVSPLYSIRRIIVNSGVVAKACKGNFQLVHEYICLTIRHFVLNYRNSHCGKWVQQEYHDR